MLLSGPDPHEVQRAKELCKDLLVNVKEQYQRFKENPPQQRGYGSGYGQGDRQGYGSYNGAYGGGYGAPSTTAQSPSTPAGPPGTPGAAGAASPTDYAAQYAQYYGGADPYAAYGHVFGLRISGLMLTLS